MIFVYDTDKKKQLIKAKRRATILLIIIAVIYVLSIYFDNRYPSLWLKLLKTMAEAGIVGGLADWFAVSALFHHIPIPFISRHTNLVVKNKNSIGKNLGKFVVDHFVTDDIVMTNIEKLTISDKFLELIKTEESINIFLQEAEPYLGEILETIEKKKYIDLSAFISKIISFLKYNNYDSKIVTYLIGYALEELRNQKESIYEEVKANSYRFIPELVDRKVANKIYESLYSVLEQSLNNPKHSLRTNIHGILDNFSDELKSDSEIRNALNNDCVKLLLERIEHEFKNDIYAHDSIVKQLIKTLLESLSKNTAVQSKIDKFIKDYLYKFIINNKNLIAEEITQRVSDWNDKQLSSTLELEVGKDLQWIRINGTVIGSIVGLVIFLITECLNSVL